jgi:hypothetical protein
MPPPTEAQYQTVARRFIHGLGNRVMQRLVPGAGVQWIKLGCYGLDPLARQRQHPNGAMGTQSGVTICITQPGHPMTHSTSSAFGDVHPMPSKGKMNITTYLY